MFFLSLLKELATDIQSLEQFDLNLNQNLFNIIIIIINYYYSLVDACCYYEMRVTQELTITDIHTVTRAV